MVADQRRGFMRVFFKIIAIFFVLISFLSSTVDVSRAQEQIEPDIPQYEQTYEGLPLCSPGVYLIPPSDCLPYGPSASLTNWAKKGLTLPLKPLPAYHPDSNFTEIDQNYAKLNIPNGEVARFYANIESAVLGLGELATLRPGEFLYISYDTVGYDQFNNTYVKNKRGWVRASPAEYTDYQGLLFRQPPTNKFGWIIDSTNPLKEPSSLAPIVNEELVRDSVVQVYDQVDAEGTTWSMIGFGKWVNRNKIRIVTPRTEPPEGVDNGRWIEVNLYEQTLSVYENYRLIFATLVSTGYDPFFTQPGLFKIREKHELETMEGAFAEGKTDYYYLENVPWTMYYDGPRALHGAYWRSKLGSELSHGCVNLSIGDSHWLYNWAEIGDWVYVWDPSGQTPTDPAFYEGSAAF